MRAKRKNKSAKKPGARIALPVILVLALVLAACGYFYVLNFDGASDPRSEAEIAFNVPSGAGTRKIAAKLENAGLIKSAGLFRIKSKLCGYDGKYQAGDFKLSPSMSMEEIMKTLQNAIAASVRFTIPEGLSVRQVGEKLAKENIIPDAEDFYEACESEDYPYDFLEGVEAKEPDPTGCVSAQANRLEGFLFPDTYEIALDGKPVENIVNIFLSRFDEIWKDGLSEAAAKRGLSPYELVTIASLIERETKTDEERPKVASVIYKRLDVGMKLQFCSTVQYVLGENKERLLNKDLEIESPYNTYLHKGLPAGPIASPGRKSLEAALNPTADKYLFFVLKGDGSGTHNFAENEKDFLKYKAEYTDSLKQKGE